LHFLAKIGLCKRSIDGFKREAPALLAFDGSGVVQIFSENTGLLLLECAVPGVSLKSYFPENNELSKLFSQKYKT
jgi:streptomycin 6-kinase